MFDINTLTGHELDSCDTTAHADFILREINTTDHLFTGSEAVARTADGFLLTVRTRDAQRLGSAMLMEYSVSRRSENKLSEYRHFDIVEIENTTEGIALVNQTIATITQTIERLAARTARLAARRAARITN